MFRRFITAYVARDEVLGVLSYHRAAAPMDSAQDSSACTAAGKRDWYAQIRAYFDKEHPIFDYDYKFQGVKV